jgi:hypothetical protein
MPFVPLDPRVSSSAAWDYIEMTDPYMLVVRDNSIVSNLDMISQRYRGIYTPLGLKFWTDLGMSAQLFLMPQKDSVLAGMLNNEDLCIALAHNEMQLSLSEAESHVDSLLDIVSWWSERVNWDISVSERLNKP